MLKRKRNLVYKNKALIYNKIRIDLLGLLKRKQL